MKKNLVPFDLGKAMSGKKVFNGFGDSVEILCNDLAGNKPIAAKVISQYTGEKQVLTFCLNGQFLDDEKSEMDLLIDDSEQEWVEIYRTEAGNYACSQESFNGSHEKGVAVVPEEWEFVKSVRIK